MSDMHEIHVQVGEYTPALKKAAIWAMMNPWQPVVCICTIHDTPVGVDYFMSDGYYTRTVRKSHHFTRLRPDAEQRCVAEMRNEVEWLAEHTCTEAGYTEVYADCKVRVCSECGREME